MEDNALNANGVHQIQIHGLLCITRTPRMTFYNTLFSTSTVLPHND